MALDSRACGISPLLLTDKLKIAKQRNKMDVRIAKMAESVLSYLEGSMKKLPATTTSIEETFNFFEIEFLGWMNTEDQAVVFERDFQDTISSYCIEILEFKRIEAEEAKFSYCLRIRFALDV